MLLQQLPSVEPSSPDLSTSSPRNQLRLSQEISAIEPFALVDGHFFNPSPHSPTPPSNQLSLPSMSDIGDPQDGQQAAAGAAGAAAGLVAAAAAVVAMPLRNERIAPVFNEIGSGLKRYFNDFEALIRRAGITDDNEKKVQSTYYLSVDTQDLWESQPSFSDASTYAQFKSAIFKLYPGSDDAAKFVRKDLDDYVASTLVKGIKNREEYGQYSPTMQYGIYSIEE